MIGKADVHRPTPLLPQRRDPEAQLKEQSVATGTQTLVRGQPYILHDKEGSFGCNSKYICRGAA